MLPASTCCSPPYSSWVSISFMGAVAAQQTFLLENGEVGVKRPGSSLTQIINPLELRCKFGRILIPVGAHVYLRANKSELGSKIEIFVLAGNVQIYKYSGDAIASAGAGQKLTLSVASGNTQVEQVDNPQPPGWAASLDKD